MKQKPENRWPEYYEWQRGRKPRPLFVEALAIFEQNTEKPVPNGRFAIDLGCGDGTETVALLEAGWQVLAIDREETAVSLLQAKIPPNYQSQIETRTTPFEDIHVLPQADFIYAGYSLPFCAPSAFAGLWQAVVTALRPGGRFAGQLFGIRDSWAKNPYLTFHTAEQVEQLLDKNFIVEVLREREEDGEALKGPKHWHQFHIIAQKDANN